MGKKTSRSSLLYLLFYDVFCSFFPRFFVVSRFPATRTNTTPPVSEESALLYLQIKLRNPQFYCINLRTASTREQPRIDPAQSSRVHTVVRSSISSLFSVNVVSLHVKKPTRTLIFEIPLTISPVTGRRLDYTAFGVDISVTDVTKNSRLFSETRSSTLLLAVLFPPIDIQPALQH